MGDPVRESAAQLPRLVREHRTARGLSLRQVGRETGLSFATVSRLEAGRDVMLSTVVAMLRWLGEPALSAAGYRLAGPGEVVVRPDSEELRKSIARDIAQTTAAFLGVLTEDGVSLSDLDPVALGDCCADSVVMCTLSPGRATTEEADRG